MIALAFIGAGAASLATVCIIGLQLWGLASRLADEMREGGL